MSTTITKPAADTHFGRRPLGRLVPRSLGRVLTQDGKKTVAVAAFGSSV